MDGTFHAYRTVVLSDVHLGSSLCDIARVNAFLEGVRCEHLILNGDIIDCWALRRGGVWGAEHTRFIGLLLAKVRHHRTRVVYVRGNHDDVLGRLLPLALDNLSIVEEHVHTMGGRDYLVVHGDAFDAVVRHNQLTTAAGNLSYHMLMAINSVYNWTRRLRRLRRLRGLEGWSLARAIKTRLPQPRRFVARFERFTAELAAKRGCAGIVAGHIHVPADKEIDGVHYLNCGDWVESFTAIVEEYDGSIKLLEFNAVVPTAFPPMVSASGSTVKARPEAAFA